MPFRTKLVKAQLKSSPFRTRPRAPSIHELNLEISSIRPDNTTCLRVTRHLMTSSISWFYAAICSPSRWNRSSTKKLSRASVSVSPRPSNLPHRCARPVT